jgi:hypothetical protein
LWRGGLVKVLEVGIAMTKEEKKKYNRAYYEANPEKEKERHRDWCEKNREKVREYDRAWREKNREKIMERDRAWRKANPEKVIKSQLSYRIANPEKKLSSYRAWRKANPEKAKASYRAWRKANPEKAKARCRDWCRKEKKENPIYAMKCRIRSLICCSLRNKGYTKKSRTHEILGCDYETFAAHLEAQFVDGMNWDNRDKWHIDHIIPLASAQTEEDVLRLNHYSNLQPLWAEDNLLKSDKMPPVQIQQRVKRNHAKLAGVHATLKQQSVFDLVAA